MSYRPITDVWILARPKVPYYGAYPAGFPERARRLLGVSLDDPVLHVCAGRVRQYPYAGAVGPHDKTIDLDPDTFPDFCIDVRKLAQWPRVFMDEHRMTFDEPPCDTLATMQALEGWPAMLIDPPYTEEDAKHYLPGLDQFPKLNTIMRNASERLRVGGRLGVLAYMWPSPPKKLTGGATMREVAVIAVGTGRNQRARWFTVWEKFGPTAHVEPATPEPQPIQETLA